ncbi:Phosphatidate phosphatase LPIN1 [Galemys pyrenaicus]|uniref:phosphatidate phosphatase n=1 Tax=Galemys pyrenaicus TaxID=202257 RepID=A0A8J6ANQ6_GALPY|nr:Phosphatidate phosphatase LPIN1 [Galemys pyrenaicus]
MDEQEQDGSCSSSWEAPRDKSSPESPWSWVRTSEPVRMLHPNPRVLSAPTACLLPFLQPGGGPGSRQLSQETRSVRDWLYLRSHQDVTTLDVEEDLCDLVSLRSDSVEDIIEERCLGVERLKKGFKLSREEMKESEQLLVPKPWGPRREGSPNIEEIEEEKITNDNAQTMNYVGQLAGQVFVTVKELYKGLNPATLSGCIDIIVVRQPNGSLQCSPFHVRFGKMGVLRSREKVVDIEINGESVDLHMKLGDNGEAFFVQETDNDQEVIPVHLATSPILSEGASLMECQLKRGSLDRTRSLDSNASVQVLPPSETTSSSSVVKKRRKRRRKSQLDSLKRDDAVNTSEDEDVFPIEMSSDEENEPTDSSSGRFCEVECGRCPDVSSTKPRHKCAGARVLVTITSMIRPRTLTSDRPSFQDEVPKEDLSPVRTYLQSASYPNSDREWTPNTRIDVFGALEWGDAAGGRCRHAQPPSRPGLLLAPPVKFCGNPSSPHKMKEASPLNSRKIHDEIHFQAIHSESSDTFSDQSPTLAGGPSVQPLFEQSKPETEMQFSNEDDMETLGAAAPPLPATEEPKSLSADKRSRHLGADGVYLDDLTDMDPEVAALYFPKNGDPSGLPKQANDNGARSANQSPQSVGSSGIDSGVESTSDGLRDLPSIAISLCGGLSDNREITKDAFSEQAVSYQQFVDNPALIDDPNLVVKIGNKYYNWTTAAPLLLAMQAFQKPLPKESKPEQGLAGKSHSTGEQPAQLSLATRWQHSHEAGAPPRAWCLAALDTGSCAIVTGSVLLNEGWTQAMLSPPVTVVTVWTLNEESFAHNLIPVPVLCLMLWMAFLPQLTENADRVQGGIIKHESSSSDEEHAAAKPSSSGHLPLLSNVSYKKTLRLTSEQLKSLKLKNGPNDVVFSVTTQYQGTCRCEGTIYLWNWDDKVVISDIDGTITRSDTLGHILPTLGKDWTHQGIAKLYHKVSQNGYKFLYCSARAIGMADMTRGYLHWVNERGTVLPQGPLLLSPSSLFSALHREVIEKKPEKFKVQCLTDIKNLFFPNTEPFYAAFGNRPADVYSYKQVGVSLNRIFTVNPKGELVQEHAKTNISSVSGTRELKLPDCPSSCSASLKHLSGFNVSLTFPRVSFNLAHNVSNLQGKPGQFFLIASSPTWAISFFVHSCQKATHGRGVNIRPGWADGDERVQHFGQAVRKT